MLLYMPVYTLYTRISSVEYSVDVLGLKADSFNAVFAGTTTINGPAFLNGPMAFGNSITGIDISDVKDLQTALGAKAIQSTTYTKTEANYLLSAKADKSTTYTKTEADDLLSAKADKATTYTKTGADDLLSAKAPLASPTFNGTVNGITKSMVGLGNVDNTSDANKPISNETQKALGTKADKNDYICKERRRSTDL